MTPKKQNPGVQAGVSLNQVRSVVTLRPYHQVQDGANPMPGDGPAIARSFEHHRDAALALLVQCPDLPHKAAGFLGHVCVAGVLSTKQRDWLVRLLARYGQPPLAEGAAA